MLGNELHVRHWFYSDKVTYGDLNKATNQLAILKNKHTEEGLKLAYQILRCLRNSCIHSKKNQNLIMWVFSQFLLFVSFNQLLCAQSINGIVLHFFCSENDIVDLFKDYTSTILDPKNISVLSSTGKFCQFLFVLCLR